PPPPPPPPPPPSDLSMLSAAVTPDGQAINATYSITGAALPSPGTVDFYWASGPGVADEIGNPVKVPTQTSLGSNTASTLISNLASEPVNAAYILAVADSPNADPNHPLASVALPIVHPSSPDLSLLSAAVTADRQSVQATYSISGAALAAPGTIDFYWASGPVF